MKTIEELNEIHHGLVRHFEKHFGIPFPWEEFQHWIKQMLHERHKTFFVNRLDHLDSLSLFEMGRLNERIFKYGSREATSESDRGVSPEVQPRKRGRPPLQRSETPKPEPLVPQSAPNGGIGVRQKA